MVALKVLLEGWLPAICLINRLAVEEDDIVIILLRVICSSPVIHVEFRSLRVTPYYFTVTRVAMLHSIVSCRCLLFTVEHRVFSCEAGTWLYQEVTASRWWLTLLWHKEFTLALLQERCKVLRSCWHRCLIESLRVDLSPVQCRLVASGEGSPSRPDRIRVKFLAQTLAHQLLVLLDGVKIELHVVEAATLDPMIAGDWFFNFNNC